MLKLKQSTKYKIFEFLCFIFILSIIEGWGLIQCIKNGVGEGEGVASNV